MFVHERPARFRYRRRDRPVAEVIDAANPARRLMARVSRTSGELDPRTRTLLAEIDVPRRVLESAFVSASYAIQLCI